MNYVTQIKKCPDKQDESDLEPTWSHVYIPFLRYSEVISALIFFSVGSCSECNSTSFFRASSNIYTFGKFFSLVITVSVNLHSIVNGILFHNIWTNKSEGRFEQFPTCIWWGFWLSIHRLIFRAFLSLPRRSHWNLKAGPLPPPTTFLKVHQF